VNRYENAIALRRALEVRLKRQSETEDMELGRLRRRVVFDRLAARLSADPEGDWILKGGAALEFRSGTGRARPRILTWPCAQATWAETP
jgi:hypothetical protein